MEGLAVLLILFLIAIIVMPFVALTKVAEARRRAEEMSSRLDRLEKAVRRLQDRADGVTQPQRAAEHEVMRHTGFGKPDVMPVPIVMTDASFPPPIPPLPQIAEPQGPKTSGPLPKQAAEPARASIAPTPAPKSQLNLEQFMGAKMFAWIGGFALFLGVAFFVKYSFEHNLIPPEVRAAIGFLVGIGLVVGGVCMKRRETRVTAQTLCATGVLVLYSVTFACRAFYHFAFFGTPATFLLMSLITATAFLLAVRMNALVVAVLGIAGGFLTPILLSSGHDTPLPLFGYIVLLDVGLLALALRQRWNSLPLLGAACTVLIQASWLTQFFVTEKYFTGDKVLAPMAVFIGFQALFLAAVVFAGRSARATRELFYAAIMSGTVAFIFAFLLWSFSSLGERPVLLFSYAFLVDLGLLALALIESELAVIGGAAGFAAFALLSLWTGRYITSAHLDSALAFYFIFAVLHSVLPIVLQRFRAITLPWWGHAFPALALVLVLMPICKLSELSILVWPFVLLVDALAIVVAVFTATLLPILVVLVLTLIATGAWIFRIPATLTGLSTSLFLVGGFAVFFVITAAWACRRFARKNLGEGKLFGDLTNPANLSVQIPALSATLPFLLLIMLTLRLPLANPSPVFGLALLLVALLLGMTRIMSLTVLPAVALGSTLLLEHAWHFNRFDPARAVVPLVWYLGFYTLFSAFPFLFHRRFEKRNAPWAVAALAGPLHFKLVYDLVKTAWPNHAMGLLPAAFAVPAFIGLAALLKRTPADSPARNAQLAWFGGSALFFVTLIFPIQFERQWITISWALEGAALCWLFRRVPHPGLRLVGVALLVISFARLALNPALLAYHPRASVALLNWYLYAYGIAASALFAGARLLAPPRNRMLDTDVPPLLQGLGTLLLFLLVNIEIADFFTAPNASVLTFQFSGNFARDMSFSIAWALFALTLLIVGIRKKIAPPRYASLGLLGLTVLKLFLHDLSQLDQLYRIGAFVAVAIVAMILSFLYQRFVVLPENEIPS
ncbi:MAG: hypothetical protein QOD99_2432 [Chthoniobacter sp.]|jgi:hypothetical protein|nr:hypothetical protein [Chthoniobacter sp.]